MSRLDKITHLPQLLTEMQLRSIIGRHLRPCRWCGSNLFDVTQTGLLLCATCQRPQSPPDASGEVLGSDTGSEPPEPVLGKLVAFQVQFPIAGGAGGPCYHFEEAYREQLAAIRDETGPWSWEANSCRLTLYPSGMDLAPEDRFRERKPATLIPRDSKPRVSKPNWQRLATKAGGFVEEIED